jgi:hypothetical protein
MRIATCFALIGAGSLGLLARAAPGQDGAGNAKAADVSKPAIRLAKGQKVLYRYREVADLAREIRPGDGGLEKSHADMLWHLELEGTDPRNDGNVDVLVRWTRIAGRTKSSYGENDVGSEQIIDTDAKMPVIRSGEPSNARDPRLEFLTKKDTVVTLTPLGKVKDVQGPARILLEYYSGRTWEKKVQRGPLAEADLAATFERWFPALPEQRPHAATTWKADRTLAPEMFTVTDLQSFGSIPEKFTAKTVKGDLVTATVTSEKKAAKKHREDEKDAPSLGPDERRPPTLGIGRAQSWNLSGDVEIDLATGLYVSRHSKVEFVAGIWWFTGDTREARGTAEFTLERMDAPAPAPGGK